MTFDSIFDEGTFKGENERQGDRSGGKTVPTGVRREPRVTKMDPNGMLQPNAIKNGSSDKVVKRSSNGPPHQDEMG